MIRHFFLRYLMLTLLGISTVAVCHEAVYADKGALRDRLQAELDSLCHEYELPGATAACMLPDGTVVSVAAGMADIDLQIPMSPQSRMLAASIGKMFVGATVLALVQEGVLDLDTPVSEWLGDRSWFSRLPNHESVTLRHLLNHTSGIPNHVESEQFSAAFKQRWKETDNPFSPVELIGFILDQPALFRPGESWSYSDTGYLLVGLVIEEVTESDYYEIVTRRFLKPLNLDLTGPSDRLELQGLATGYTTTENPFGLPAKTTVQPGIMAWNPSLEWTGGGLVSNPADLVRWGRALFEGSAIKGNYLDDLLKSVPIHKDNPETRYGIAVAIRRDGPFGPSYGHGGWIPGYCSSLRYYPDAGVAVAFQVNTDIGIVDTNVPVTEQMESRLADIAVTAVSR